MSTGKARDMNATSTTTPQRQRRNLSQSKRVGVPSGRGRFLRLDDMIASTGLSEATIRRRMAAGKLPPSVSLSTRCVGWWEADYLAWAEQQRTTPGAG